MTELLDNSKIDLQTLSPPAALLSVIAHREDNWLRCKLWPRMFPFTPPFCSPESCFSHEMLQSAHGCFPGLLPALASVSLVT